MRQTECLLALARDTRSRNGKPAKKVVGRGRLERPTT